MATFAPGPPPGGAQQPTPEQIKKIQRQIADEAAKEGLTVPQYIEKMKTLAQQHNHDHDHDHNHDHDHDHGHNHGPLQSQSSTVNVNPQQPGPPNPAAIAVANFLKSQELKHRTCLYQEKRRDMFRVKRAIRALQSPAYEKARAKNSLLPEVKDRPTAESAFKLLPLSLLALRVSKVDPSAGHEGHGHGRPKRVKGLWTVRIEQQQDTGDDDHYMWLFEGSQWKQKLYAVLALIAVFAVVLFPLWPLVVRQGVWYLSVGFLMLLGLFFAMAIFRLILFCITVFTLPRGLWLYPNLFEDVGFFDSFRPVWAWQEDKKAKKKAKKEATVNGKPKKSKSKDKAESSEASAPDQRSSAPAASSTGVSTGVSTSTSSGLVQSRNMQARVEEAEDD